MPISRQSTFTEGATLSAAQLNAEFEHIVDAFDGTGTIALEVGYSAADQPTLTVDNTGSGIVAEFQVNSTAKVRINADGQLQSTIATGTAPLIIASTTAVNNLNADQVDGYEAADFIRDDVNNQVVADSAAEVYFTLRTTGQGADAGNVYLELDAQDGSNNPDAKWRLNVDGDDRFLLEQYDDGTSSWLAALEFDRNGGTPYTKVYDPTEDDMKQIATTSSKTTISVGAFYEGEVSTGAKQIRWIAPTNAEGITFTYMRAVYGGGSPSGTTTIQVQQFGVAGSLKQTRSMNVLSTDTVDNTIDHNMTDITSVADGDFFEITITAAGGHEDLSFWMQGTQDLIT